MKLLIVYGTTEGHTRKVSQFLKDEAEKLGHEVSLFDSHSKPDTPGAYDAVLLAGSVHLQQYQHGLLRYIKQNKDALDETHNAFISVSMTATQHDKQWREELDKVDAKFVKATGWVPAHTEYVAGALLYLEYNWFKRYIMKLISEKTGHDTDTSQDYEYTDWNKLRIFLQGFLEQAG